MKRVIAVIMALVLVTLACTVTPTVGGGDGGDDNVLFFDDFSSTGSGWDQVTQDNGVTDYYNGGYRIYVTTDMMDLWANPGKSFQADVRIEVDATKTDGPDDNDLGVICRYQDASNYYYFLISSDGYAVIARVLDGNQEYISADSMVSTDAIHQGDATNHIRADCVGSSLALYVNGVQVATVSDSSFSRGDVGLIAGTFSEPGTDILFDNFYVYKP